MLNYDELNINLILSLFISFEAPPEITVEKSWVHAAEGHDVELACIVHGDVNSEVNNCHT